MAGFAKVNSFSSGLGGDKTILSAYLSVYSNPRSPQVTPNHLWVSVVHPHLGSLCQDYHLQLVGHELYFGPHASLPWLVPMLEYSEQGYGVPLSSKPYSLRYH